MIMTKRERISAVKDRDDLRQAEYDRGRVTTPVEQLEDGLLIDEHDLDTALVRQPDLFYRVSKQLVSLISRRDAAKQDLAEEEARCDGQFRKDAVTENEKVTEAEVKALIKLDREVKKKTQLVNDLVRQVGEFTALKDAFGHRSDALKGLVKLFCANYYETSSAGEDASAHRQLKDHDADRARRGLKEARRRRHEPD
jgi:hypothetical protein